MKWPLWTRTRPVHPNNCETVDSLLSLYADNMASAEEVRSVEAHLPDCASCRASLAWMQATQRTLAARPVATPPADLRARIAAAIAVSTATPATAAYQSSPARSFTLRPAYAAAASLTILGVVGYGFLHSSPSHVKSGVNVTPKPTQVAVAPKAKTPVLEPSVKLPVKTIKTSPGVPVSPVSRETDRVATITTGETRPRAADQMTLSNRMNAEAKTTPKLIIPLVPTNKVRLAASEKPALPKPNVRIMATKAPLSVEAKKKPLPDVSGQEKVALLPKVPVPSVAVTIAPTVVKPDPAPIETVAAAPAPQSDLLLSVRTHVGNMRSVALFTGGKAIKGAVYVSHRLESDKTAYIDGIHTP